MAIDEVELGKQLREWRRLLATEVGTEPACPFCKRPRLAVEEGVRMAALRAKSAGTSAAAADGREKAAGSEKG